MEFIITKTSTLGTNIKPCKGAIQKSQEFICGGQKAIDKFFVIEINSLEELLKLVDEEDEGIIIFPASCYASTEARGYKYKIEIYDEYRE